MATTGEPFLITGLGASGTRWLARQLAAAIKWQVFHEPDDEYYVKGAPDFTGAVDSTMRHSQICEDYLEKKRLAIIVRNPVDIAKHCFYKGTWDRVKKEFPRDLNRLIELADKGAKVFSFWRVTRAYKPVQVFSWCGIGHIGVRKIRRIGHQRPKVGAHTAENDARAMDIVKQFRGRFADFNVGC